MLGAKLRYLAVFVLIVAAMGFLFVRMPTAYLPDEDQGVLLAMVQLPPGSTLEQTRSGHAKGARPFPRGSERSRGILHDHLPVSAWRARAQNQGMAYIKLRDWDLRNRPDLRVEGIVGKAMPALAGIREATVYCVSASCRHGTRHGEGIRLHAAGPRRRSATRS